jgi:hypothetical protein
MWPGGKVTHMLQLYNDPLLDLKDKVEEKLWSRPKLDIDEFAASFPSTSALALLILQNVAVGRDTVDLLAVSIAEQLGLTAAERDLRTASGRSFLIKRVGGLARRLVRVGLLMKTRIGYFATTELGQQELAGWDSKAPSKAAE